MGQYRLVDSSGHVVPSATPGTRGGHRRTKIFGRLDCPSAARAIARGGYRRYRVFFADAETARAAGFRPCAVCLPDDYRTWKSHRMMLPGSSRRGRVIAS
jgi:Metal binding domain of Ada